MDNVMQKPTEQTITDFMATYSRADILSRARQDGERPFGVVITWLRDYFHIPKSLGGATAMEILNRYNIQN